MDGIVRGRPAKTNQNLAPWTRKRWFLVDGSWWMARITQHNLDPVQHALEKKDMIPGGWNAHYDTGPVEDTMEEKR